MEGRKKWTVLLVCGSLYPEHIRNTATSVHWILSEEQSKQEKVIARNFSLYLGISR